MPGCTENSKSYGGGGLYLQSINQVTLGYDVVFNNVPENTNASESYFASAGLSIFNQDGQVSFSLSSQNYIGCVCLTSTVHFKMSPLILLASQYSMCGSVFLCGHKCSHTSSHELRFFQFCLISCTTPIDILY